VLADPDAHPGALVLVDHQAAKLYTSNYGIVLPPVVTIPREGWIPVWSHHAYPPGGGVRTALETGRSLAQMGPTNPISLRIVRGISDMIDDDAAALYRVPGGGTDVVSQTRP
jgi:hypothetical protein